LAHAGLLAGRRATTHWQYAERLAADFPDVLVEPDRIFVRDGPVFSSAGVTAAIDLAFSLIEEDHGRALALWATGRMDFSQTIGARQSCARLFWSAFYLKTHIIGDRRGWFRRSDISFLLIRKTDFEGKR
jgi:putative intracellular protease/amidase